MSPAGPFATGWPQADWPASAAMGAFMSTVTRSRSSCAMIAENSINAMHYTNNFNRVALSSLALSRVPIEVFPRIST